MDLDEYIDWVNDKMSSIPNFDKESVESLLTTLPYADDSEKKEIMEEIDFLVNPPFYDHKMNSKNPVLSFPSASESMGDGIRAGMVMCGDVELHFFEFTCENLRESMFAVARSGHGKTTLVFYFVGQLVKQKINFLFPDWKNDYRSLALMYDDILVIRWDELRFNPLTNAPEGMELKEWWRIVFDIFSHSFGLFTATPSHILENLEELYEEKRGDVTFKSLLEYLKSQNAPTNREGEYAVTAKNRLYDLNNALDKVINVRYGFDISRLFHGRIVIEFSPLDAPIASFLIQTLIMHEFHRRLKNQIRLNRKSTLDSFFRENFTLLIMDEFHLSAYRGQEESWVSIERSLPPLSTFFSQSREMMMSTFGLTQFPNMVMESFRNNAGCRMIGNITEARMQKELADSVGLDQEDAKAVGKLQKGMWIVTVSGRAKPFLMKIPETSKGELVADAEILQRSKPLLTALQMKRQEIESRMFMNKIEKDSDKIYLPDLPADAWKVLDYAFHHEFAYQKQIADGIGLSSHKLDDMKKLLLAKNLIRIETFRVFTHNRAHYVLTPKILEIFKTLGKNPQRISYWRFLSTNPGYYHRYFQFLFLGMHRKLGWKGSVERDLPNGRRVDIYIQRDEDGKRKVIEIETSTTDLTNKVRVIQEGYCDELVLLYRDMSGVQLARSKLEKIEGINGETVWLGLITDYLELITGILKARENRGNERNQNNSPYEESKNDTQTGKEGETS